MSSQYGKVITLILLERFGPIVEKVGTYLFQYGSNPLLHIKKSTDLPISKVKESLCILIKYNLVTFKPNKNANIANYTLKCDSVLLMLRYPKYLNLVKKKYGDASEMIIEELLQRSYWTASELTLQVVQRLRKVDEQSTTFTDVRDKLEFLITAKYIQRLPAPLDEEKPVPTFESKSTDLHAVPKIDLKLLAQVLAGQIKVESLVDNVLWTVNFDRFHQDIRDNLMVAAFTKKFDENASELVKLLLQQMYVRTEPWADVSNPIPLIEIKDIVRKQVKYPNLLTFFDHYVNVIEQDNSKIIRKAGEASGGSFQIYLKEAFEQFVWETVEQVILEKYDAKAARIFRLVKLKKYIEPDQIQQLAMIPAKEAKRLSYQLLEENFLKTQELKKPISNNGPNKSFILFYIDLESVVRMLLELCYKTIFNALIRKNHEKFVNKRIIDKKQRVDTIIMGMRTQGASDDQLKDIEEMITPPEKEVLEKINQQMKKLNTVELEIDDTLFFLQTYLVYK